jgi:hypothetical protein
MLIYIIKIGTNLTNAIRLTTKNVLVNEIIYYSIPEWNYFEKNSIRGTYIYVYIDQLLTVLFTIMLGFEFLYFL